MSNVSSMKDIQELFKETIAEFFENGLESELEEKLGYSKYDYRTTGTSSPQTVVSVVIRKLTIIVMDIAVKP